MFLARSLDAGLSGTDLSCLEFLVQFELLGQRLAQGVVVIDQQDLLATHHLLASPNHRRTFD